MFIILVLIVFCGTFMLTVLYHAIRAIIPHKQVYAPNFDALEDDISAETEEAIAFYEIRIEQLKELSRMYEAELNATTDAKKRKTLLSRCISLDKQTYDAQQKLNKLKSEG